MAESRDTDDTSIDRPTDRPTDGPMDEDELKAIIAGEIQSALGADGGRLSHERRRLLEFYQGGFLGNEVEGRSQVVTRDVFEAVEWVLPACMAPFVSTDKVCEFQPYRPQEEQMAQAASAYVNFILTRDNNFFKILFTWIKDCLIQKNSYIQVYWKEENIITHDSYTGLSDLEYQQVQTGDALRDKYPGLNDAEIVDHHEYPNGDPLTAPIFPTLHDCRVRVRETIGRVCIENVAPEEMLISPRTPDHLLDGKHFVCRRTAVRVSDLRERGYPEDLIERAIGYDDMDYNTERIARFQKDDDWPRMGERTDDAMREGWLEESYIPVDWDGDGVAELRRVVTAGQGSVLFENEPADDIIFVSLTPIPLPHKHVGMSLAETVVDLQEISSTLWRQSLDGLYLSTMPRVIVSEMAATTETFDDLLNPEIGSPIRVADIDGIKPFEIPFTAQQAMPMLEYLAHTREIRTGVANQQINMSPDDLNRFASGYAVNLMQQAGSKRVELFTRIFADGVKQLCQKVLGLVVRHQDRAREIKISGQWIAFDPRSWRESLDVSVDVGLGTGNKDQMLQHLVQILQIQQGIAKDGQGTPFGSLVTPQNVFDVATKICENAGFKQQFFNDPTQQAQQQQQPGHPNPAMVKAQADAQAAQFRASSEMQMLREKAQLEAQLEQERHQLEMQRDQQRFEAELARDRSRQQFKMDLEIHKEQVKAQAAQQATAPVVAVI